MKKTALLIFGILMMISCRQIEKRHFIETVEENWKKQLITNGEVGNPCLNNADTWASHNPESYYGLPKEGIKVRVFDANSDDEGDILLFFPAGDCCSCTIGVNQGSDFVKLVYSDGDHFLDNDNLRAKIEQKIQDTFNQKNDVLAKRVVFTITDFTTDILGTYLLWTTEDPDCCASYEGTFKYNPFTFKIEISSKVVENK